MRRRLKNQIKHILATAIALLVVMQIFVGANAGVVVNVTLYSQSADEACCWAYCGTSVCRYYGIGITVDQFIYTVKGSTSHYVSGTISEIAAGLAYNGISCTYLGDVLSYYTTKTQINSGHPIIYDSQIYAGIDSDGNIRGSGHAIIVSGYDASTYSYRITDTLKDAHEYHSVTALTSILSAEEPYLLRQCLYGFN